MKHLVLEKGSWLSGSCLLCWNQGCRFLFVELLLSRDVVNNNLGGTKLFSMIFG